MCTFWQFTGSCRRAGLHKSSMGWLAATGVGFLSFSFLSGRDKLEEHGTSMFRIWFSSLEYNSSFNAKSRTWLSDWSDLILLKIIENSKELLLMSIDVYYMGVQLSSVAQSCLTLLPPCGPEPASLLCPRDFPGKNTGVGCHFFL